MRSSLLAAFAIVTVSLAACGGSDDSGLFSQTGAAGSGTAGASSGGAGNGTSGSGTAGSGTAGTGTSGSGTAGTGTSGSGTSGSGTAGTGTSGSGTSGSGTAGTGTAGTGTSGSGTAGSGSTSPPTSCEEAHGIIGCCSPDGQTNYWYGNGQLNTDPCMAGSICGWSASSGYYVCVTGTTPTTDPSGKAPYGCGLPKVEGTCMSGAGGSGTAGSGTAGKAGSGTAGTGPGPGMGGMGGSGPVICNGVTCQELFPGVPACCANGMCGIELQPGSCTPF